MKEIWMEKIVFDYFRHRMFAEAGSDTEFAEDNEEEDDCH